MKGIRYILAAAAIAVAMPLGAKDYYASTFNIKSNGTTMNTRSIQAAIDHISGEGGGKLIFKVGRYLTGSIYLKDNVTIELGEGAILLGSTNPWDYDKMEGCQHALVNAKGAKNIAITGLGVIEGQGRETANNFLAMVANGLIKDELKLGRASARPHLIYLRECENVTIKGINLRNAACWTSTYDQCHNLHIDGVTVDSRAYWNNDGIDVVDCVDAVVENCFVSAADDGICLKSHSANHCNKNVIVRNNVITSSASGIKFGTFGKGGFVDIQILNNTVYDTFRSAIAIEEVDGGLCENVVVDGLKSLNTANPIFVILGKRYGQTSKVNNIVIRNVYAEVPATKPDRGYDYEGPTLEDEPRNCSPCSIVGLEDEKVTNITLENIEIVFPGQGNPEYAHVTLKELDNVPEMPTAYPEFSQFVELPAWGFYLRHVDGVQFRNIKLTATEKDYRPAIVCHDVQNGTFEGVKAVSPKLKGTIYTYKCKNIKK